MTVRDPVKNCEYVAKHRAMTNANHRKKPKKNIINLMRVIMLNTHRKKKKK